MVKGNWPLLVGFILALSPITEIFSNPLFEYYLRYSLLGYGLIVIALLTVPKKAGDWTTLCLLSLSIAFELMNWFFMETLFLNAFYFTFFWFNFCFDKQKIIRVFSNIALFILGILAAEKLFALLQETYYYLTIFSEYSPALLNVFAIILLLLKRSQKEPYEVTSSS